MLTWIIGILRYGMVVPAEGKDREQKGGLDNTLCPSPSLNSALCVLPTLCSPMLDLDWTKVLVVFPALGFPNGKRTIVCLILVASIRYLSSDLKNLALTEDAQVSNMC